MAFQIATLEQKVFFGGGDKSILDEAFSSGYVFEYSCKNGQCGVCKSSLISGEVMELQPQLALTDEDRLEHKFLTCCCAPAADIVIDSEDLSALHGIDVKTLPAKISYIKLLSDRIIEVHLRFPPTSQFKFLEGQYLNVIHSLGTRSYSIASVSGQAEVKLLIKKVDQGVLSHYWFEQAVLNDLLRVEGPKGTFYLRHSDVPLIFLATGTGVAPAISILEKLDGDSSFKQSCPIYLFWGNRERKDFVLDFDFQNIDVEIVFVLSGNDGSWDGERGYVQDVAIEKIKGIEKYHVYACGSNNMIVSARGLLVEKGLEKERFYSDAFVPTY